MGHESRFEGPVQDLDDAIGFELSTADESKLDDKHFCKVAKHVRSEFSTLIRC